MSKDAKECKEVAPSVTRMYINVGGFVYDTTAETLRKSPKLKELIDQNADGELFVDRDGVAFGYVLSFLRNNAVFHIDDRDYIEFLMSEAVFYGLKRMESQLASMVPVKTMKTPVHEIRDELRSIRLLLRNFIEAQQGRISRPNTARDLASMSEAL